MIRMRNRLSFRPSLRPMTQLPPGFNSFSSRKARKPSASSALWRARTHSLSGVPWDRKRSYPFDGSPAPDITPPRQRHRCPTRSRGLRRRRLVPNAFGDHGQSTDNKVGNDAAAKVEVMEDRFTDRLQENKWRLHSCTGIVIGGWNSAPFSTLRMVLSSCQSL